jgi:hypothetical protein
MSSRTFNLAPLRSEGTLHSNPSEKANILNKQFQSAFTSEANTNIPDKGPSTHPTMEPIKISRDGVYKLIKNINPSKATGPDTIAGRVLKENIDICTDILTLLFTKSLETGKVPSDWKHANVTPVLKKGDKHNPGNFLYSSLLCGTLSKAFAKSIIIKSVCMFLSLFCDNSCIKEIICDSHDRFHA